jgi:hypothetical protein
VFSGFRTKLFKEPKIVFSNHLMMLAASTLSRDFRKKDRHFPSAQTDCALAELA